MDKKYVVYTISYQGVVKYVGQTCDFEKRKKEHLSQKDKSAIPLDVDLDNIMFEIIDGFDQQEEVLKCEDQLILQYNTIENGWNKARSGLISKDKGYNVERAIKWNNEHQKEHYVHQRKYYQGHTEKCKSASLKWNKEHKEKMRESNRKWKKQHKEEYNAYQRAYYARKKAEKKFPA